MGPAQCPCLLRQREFPGRLRNGRFFESLPAMGILQYYEKIVRVSVAEE